MPNWKKLITSGSSASLSNIFVTNAVTASYFKGDGSALTNVTTEIAETATVSDTFTSVTEKAVTHNFNTKNVIVTVYNDSDEQIIPSTVVTTDVNTVTVTFDTATTGRIVIAKGGHLVQGIGTSSDSNTLNGQSGSYYLDLANHTGALTASNHIIPSVTETYDLGTSDLRWRDLYLSGSTIYLDNTKLSADSNGDVSITDATSGDRKVLKINELEIASGSSVFRIKVDPDTDSVQITDQGTGNAVSTYFYKLAVSESNSYNITHSLNEEYPIVQVYDSASRQQVIPATITSSNENVVQLTFDSTFNGTVVVKK